MIFESDKVLLTEEDKNILSTYQRIGVFDTIWDQIQSKREYLESQNEKIVNRAQSLEKSIGQLDADIAELVEEVNDINARIVATKDKIDTNTQAIALLKNKISNNTQVLLEYLVYLYKKWEFITSSEEMDNLKTILLSWENIDSVLNDMYFKSIIQVTGQQLVENHRSYISELYKKQIQLNEDEEQLKALRKQGVLEKWILDDKRASKQRLLDATKGQEELYQKYIAEKLEVERDIKVKELRERISLNNTKKSLLERYNCEFVDLGSQDTQLLDISDQCMDINKIIFAESRLTWVPTENNPFDWPVQPYLGVSAFYRDVEYRNQFNTDHDAIDIVAPQGTEIKAPMDWYVIYLQPPVNNGYAYIALKHSDWLVSLYGHISETMVGRYDFVKRWEVFAKTGGEYGTNGAWILTTGPHLHFVVYDNEEYSDPLEYLDISYIDFRNVPERYTYKYYSDFKTRKWYEYTSTTQKPAPGVFRIEWDSEIERQQFLLDVYAVGWFRDWNMWVEESVWQWIDPTFTMCIGLAETSLWKYMKSMNNIGNVWNNDRGDTRDFPTPRSAVAAMAAVFNNRYLWQYTAIEQLSRYGNKTGSIYASSDFNWHNNITKCMSHVKWHYIPDNYGFRLNQ